MYRFPSVVSLPLSIVACAACFWGLGTPNHPYQVVVAFSVLAVAYHRRLLPLETTAQGYLLALVNAFNLSMLSKLVIGGGVRTPLAWLKYPSLSASADPSWLQILPKFMLQWQASPMAHWQVDLTQIQSFLLAVTAVAGAMKFQPFASLTALLLLLFSIPGYADFRWDWLLPSIAVSAASFYVQAHSGREKRARA